HRRVDGSMEERRAGGWERPSPGERATRTADRTGQIARPPAREIPPTGQMQRPASGQQRPQTRAQPTRNRQQELNGTLQSRNRGAARTQQFNRSRTGGAAQPGGGRRRGDALFIGRGDVDDLFFRFRIYQNWGQ
ncbi:MAG: hypothetical protein V3W24_01395, partial [Gemmatimonadota bacterium]